MPNPSIIFLPGFMCDERLFAPQIAHLERLGMECHSGDLTQATSVERLAMLVLRQAPPRFALVGLSMGGIVAMEICRQAPERITHLALLNTTPQADKAGMTRKAQLKRVAAGNLGLVLREDLKPQYLAPENRSTALLDLLVDMGEALGEDVFVKQTMALLLRPSSVRSLPEISCPTAILAGEQDRVCPPDLHRDMARAISGATLDILSTCGHLSTLEQPDQVSVRLEELLARPIEHRTRNGKQGLKLV